MEENLSHRHLVWFLLEKFSPYIGREKGKRTAMAI